MQRSRRNRHSKFRMLSACCPLSTNCASIILTILLLETIQTKGRNYLRGFMISHATLQSKCVGAKFPNLKPLMMVVFFLLINSPLNKELQEAVDGNSPEYKLTEIKLTEISGIQNILALIHDLLCSLPRFDSGIQLLLISKQSKVSESNDK